MDILSLYSDGDNRRYFQVVFRRRLIGQVPIPLFSFDGDFIAIATAYKTQTKTFRVRHSGRTCPRTCGVAGAVPKRNDDSVYERSRN